MDKHYAQQCFPILRTYLGYMENIKGHSEKTVDGYFVDLRTFFRFLKQYRGLADEQQPESEIVIDDIDLPMLQSVTLNDLYEYLNYAKRDRHNNNKTLARKTVSLRMFFRHLTDHEHLLEHNPAQNLETPKTKKALPKYLSLEQSKELLQSVDGEFAERDYCMLSLLLNCGLRRAEIAALNVDSVHSDHTLTVLGKGNKERSIYLNEACQEALERYLKVRPVDGVRDKKALFLSRLKKRISVQGVHYVVKGYLEKIPGLEEYSTHKLRHTAATLMYQYGGVDIRVLKEILGHENLGTTEIYTHLSSKQIQEAAEKNPLAHLSPPNGSSAHTSQKSAKGENGESSDFNEKKD